MNEQGAIKDIRENICTGKGSSILCRDECMYGERRCAYQLAIKAIEKQIPKKPKTIINEFDGFKIGNVMFGKGTKIYRCQCGCFITKAHDYCPKCGNKIDWTVEE